jgi:hypothetical protein
VQSYRLFGVLRSSNETLELGVDWELKKEAYQEEARYKQDETWGRNINKDPKPAIRADLA